MLPKCEMPTSDKGKEGNGWFERDLLPASLALSALNSSQLMIRWHCKATSRLGLAC